MKSYSQSNLPDPRRYTVEDVHRNGVRSGISYYQNHIINQHSIDTAMNSDISDLITTRSQRAFRKNQQPEISA